MGYLYNMKVTISESQFIRMVNNSKGWGLIGINEGKTINTPEYIKQHSEDLEKKYLGTIDGEPVVPEYTVVDKLGVKDENGKKNQDYKWLNTYNKTLGNKIINKKFFDVGKTSPGVRITPKEKEIKSNEYSLKYLGKGFDINGNYISGLEVKDVLKQNKNDYNWLNDYNKTLLNKINDYNGVNNIKYTPEQKKEESNKLELKYLGTVNGIPPLSGYTVVDELTARTKEGEGNKDYKWLSNYDILLRDKIMDYYRTIPEKKIKFPIKPYTPEQKKEESNKIFQKYQKNKGSYINKTEYKWLYVHNPKLLEKIQLEFKKDYPEKWKESQGEKMIREILTEMKFTNLDKEHVYDDCKGSISCRKYRFDVYLPYTEDNEKIYEIITKNENGVLPKTGILFEFDGIGHFKSIEYWGGDMGLLERINNDVSKNEYTSDKNIKLIRIPPYTSSNKEIMKRQIIDALNNPNQLVLTGDYPKLGWNK
jgi:hypothetical protein